jgi:multidrug efflux system outer membrane protein
MDVSVSFLNTKHAKHLIARAIACSMLLVLPSCGIPPLRQAQPGPPLPASYPACFPGANSPENSSQIPFDEFFDDPLLKRLIAQALAGNLELRILNEDIQIARNEVWGRSGAYLPSVDFGVGAGLERSSLFTPLGAAEKDLEYLPGKHFPYLLGNFLVAADISWQIDIWRQLRNARDAAKLRFLATAEGRNYMVTRLIAEIAGYYYGLMALDKRLDNLNRIIALQEQSLKAARALFGAGRVTDLPIQRFVAEVRKNQSQKLIVVQDIIEVENRINFLVGRFPQPVERNTGDFIDLNLHALSVGVPAQLLLNRPDVRQAERDLEANGLDVKVARARFFPTLAITGPLGPLGPNSPVGFQAFNPKYLFYSPESLLVSVAGDLVVPLINKRAIQADYKTANARQLQSVYNYQRVILNAFTEVVNRVSKVQNYSKSIELKKQQLKALETAVPIARKLFDAVRVEYIDLLFAQRDLWEAVRDLIETKQGQLTAIVDVYQALGGGLPPNFNLETAAGGKKNSTGDCAPPMPQPGFNLGKPTPPASDHGAGEQLPSPRKVPESDKPSEKLPGPRQLLPEPDKVPKPSKLPERPPEPGTLPQLPPSAFAPVSSSQ